MLKGIYIALSGAVLKQRQMDIFAQNMANVNTSGYKKERISFKDHLVTGDNGFRTENNGRIMTELSEKTTDFSAGPISKTGNTLDMAINGEGFFALEGGQYTRNGRFNIDGGGNIIDSNGIKVLGDGGPLTISGNKVEVSGSGEILVDDISIGKFKIVSFPDKSVLSKLNGGVFTSEEAGEDMTASVSQGYLEESNVNVIRELVEMITAQREFEAHQKMIRTFDDAASKTINEMGR